MDKIEKKAFQTRLRFLKNRYLDLRVEYINTLETWIFYFETFPDSKFAKYYEKRTEQSLLNYSRAYRDYFNYRRNHLNELKELNLLDMVGV